MHNTVLVIVCTFWMDVPNRQHLVSLICLQRSWKILQKVKTQRSKCFIHNSLKGKLLCVGFNWKFIYSTSACQQMNVSIKTIIMRQFFPVIYCCRQLSQNLVASNILLLFYLMILWVGISERMQCTVGTCIQSTNTNCVKCYKMYTSRSSTGLWDQGKVSLRD